jgi:hypothetical protein
VRQLIALDGLHCTLNTPLSALMGILFVFIRADWWLKRKLVKGGKVRRTDGAADESPGIVMLMLVISLSK